MDCSCDWVRAGYEFAVKFGGDISEIVRVASPGNTWEDNPRFQLGSQTH
jgi:hypothetical protein